MCTQTSFNNEQVKSLNQISRFLALRDLPALNKEELSKKYNLEFADVLILLGSSLIYTVDLAANAFKEGLVKKILVVGGIGHSTQYLYDNIRKHSKYNKIEINNRSEADIYSDILVKFHHIPPDAILIENLSTNCGSNAKNAYLLFKEYGIKAHTFILMQDPTMQLRTYASFLKEWQTEDVLFINYAPIVPLLSLKDNKPLINGMIEEAWSTERFISLLMGEIPRLQDNALGYGPKGKGYIVHIDLPDNILSSYQALLSNQLHNSRSIESQ
ncbi:YdcF family protein [Cellulosilyticum sp. I15G10I2]|uniref:YdcF family protein n=1 Tax=Cellulosilyticum sp. I15G10I2 TaxID=1892843 RepID=UPI00085C07F5|nr:YdcF family protein [Cellulosilyticum sp. I15G10I2]